MQLINYEEAYINGIKSWNKNDNKMARYWLEISYQSIEYRDSSLFLLVKIDYIEGKYARARKLLEENKDGSDIKLKLLYGLLESIENNYETSKKYYSECMVDVNLQYRALLALSKLYIQMGDYLIGQKMLETLTLSPHFHVQTIFELVYLSIIKTDYEEGLKLLNNINPSLLNSRQQKHYKILNAYLLFYLGVLKRSDIAKDECYVLQRLFDDNDEVLLEHIYKHTNQEERTTNGCFFKYIDLKKLLKDAKDKIEEINPNHFEASDMYRFRLDTPIGFKDEDITYDLCVTTMLGTKRICTMYPVLLSKDFDKEGLAKSKELSLKRNLKGK